MQRKRSQKTPVSFTMAPLLRAALLAATLAASSALYTAKDDVIHVTTEAEFDKSASPALSHPCATRR